jgi:hypothetical protein
MLSDRSSKTGPIFVSGSAGYSVDQGFVAESVSGTDGNGGFASLMNAMGEIGPQASVSYGDVTGNDQFIGELLAVQIKRRHDKNKLSVFTHESTPSYTDSCFGFLRGGFRPGYRTNLDSEAGSS